MEKKHTSFDKRLVGSAASVKSEYTKSIRAGPMNLNFFQKQKSEVVSKDENPALMVLDSKKIEFFEGADCD